MLAWTIFTWLGFSQKMESGVYIVDNSRSPDWLGIGRILADQPTVRFGSKAVIDPDQLNVRFAPIFRCRFLFCGVVILGLGTLCLCRPS